MKDPLGRLFPGLPRNVRVVLDWVLTIAGAIVIVFGLKMWVVNPYRIPSSSMEPTLRWIKEKFSKNLITSAEQASAVILKAVRHNKRRVLVGWDAVVLDKVQRLFPAAYAVIIGMIIRRVYRR